MCLVFTLIFLFIPWQVAFLGCWTIHLSTCASRTTGRPLPGSSLSLVSSPNEASIPLTGREPGTVDDKQEPQPKALEETRRRTNNKHHSMHLLLLVTWLLPLVAPVLAVWVRTLLTAGLTTPFTGDHFFPNVAPFLVLVDFASWTNGPLFEKQKYHSFFCLLNGADYLFYQI
jgi:glycosylphosphatidylinositol deacylase